MGCSFKYTRCSAICQIVLGVLSIVFGVADRAFIYHKYYATHSNILLPIWMGAWIVFTGVIGVCGMPNSASNGRPSGPLIGTYLGFSIVSTICAAIIVIVYILGLISTTVGFHCSNLGRHYDDTGRLLEKSVVEEKCNTSVALGSLVVIVAIHEFCVGVWASICACSNGPSCDCCINPTVQQPAQMGQVIYIQTQHGPQACIVTQGTHHGVPVAVPASRTLFASPIGGTHDTLQVQLPLLQTKSRDMPPPAYQLHDTHHEERVTRI